MLASALRYCLLAAAVLLLTAGALLTAPGSPHPPAAAAATQVEPGDGAALYYRTCAACHGTEGEGLPGEGVTAGPRIDGLPLAYVDLVLRTGRMPIAHEEVGVLEQQLSDEQREALLTWAAAELDLTGTIPVVGPGDAGPGQELYVRYCAACHGSAAGGGVVGDGNVAPPLVDREPVALAEAARVGPFSMPAFDEGVLSDEEIADIAAFVDHIDEAPATPLGFVEVGQVVAAVFVVGLVVAAVGIAVAVGRLGAPRQEDT